MSKISITFGFESLADAQDFLAAASGEAVETADVKKPRGKASKNAAEGAAQTAAANTPPSTPAAAAPSIDETKAKIAAHFGPATKPGFGEDVTAFVKSFGVANMSSTNDDVRVKMVAKLAELGSAKPAAVDPMS